MSAEIQLGWNNGKLQAGAAGAAAIVNKAAAQMKGALSNVTSGIGAGLGITPFLGITAAVTGAVVALKGIAEEYDHLWDLSQRLNESPESIQRIGLMAKLSGSDVDVVAKALQKMNLELRKGADSEGVKALKAMGVNAADLLALSPEKQIATLAAAYQKAQASGVGFVEMQTLLGKKFAELVPLLKSSQEELAAMSETGVVSNQDVEAIAKGADAFDKMWNSVKVGAARTISALSDFVEMGQKGIRVFDEDRRVAENLNEVLRQQQRDIDAVVAAKKDAIEAADQSIKKSKEEAAAIDKVSKSYEDQANKLNASRDAYIKAYGETGSETATNEEKLASAKQRVLEIDKQISAVIGQPGNEDVTYQLLTEREKTMREILQISKDISAESQQAADAETEKKRAADEVASKYKTNLQMLDLELAILNAQSSGRDKKAKQLEHERDVQEETARIVEATGLAYSDAAKKAEQLVSAKEKADGRGKDGNGGRSKIYGYSQDQGDAAAARKRGDVGRNDAREKYMNAVDRTMGMKGLGESRLTTRGGDIGARTPATDAVKPSGDSEVAMVIKGFTEKAIDIFSQALA